MMIIAIMRTIHSMIIAITILIIMTMANLQLFSWSIRHRILKSREIEETAELVWKAGLSQCIYGPNMKSRNAL